MHKDYLWEKLGPLLQQGLRDPAILELMLNPDGALWFTHKEKGHQQVGQLSENASGAFVHALAHYTNKFLHEKTPYLDTTLPFKGERVNVTVPPISEGISFNIRKKAHTVFTLDDYVKATILTPKQAHILVESICERKNILVSGSPASGKTTLTNALLAAMANVVPEGHRVLILEQIPELQCQVKNLKVMQVSDHVTMNQLLWLSMRSSPQRIVIGEVRDGAALAMLKAWNTGCPGGIATIHANNAQAGVQRVLDLACETVVTPPYVLTAEALDVIVHIEACAKHPARRVVTDILAVKGFNYDRKTYHFEKLA